MKNKIIVLLLILITLLGGFLRFYKFTQNPPSLNGDEISFGYAAYSVLKTGRDENNKFMPLTFQSVGDYKNPVPAYLMMVTIGLFGLTEFSVRLPNAFFATLMIPLFFLFLLKIFKNKNEALIGTFFLAISSWHILFSRSAYEPLIGGFFVFLGVWFYIKMLESDRKAFAVLSAFFLVLTMYTAFAPRLFVPVFIFFAGLINLGKFKKSWSKLILFLFLSLVFVLPLAYVSVFQGAGTRFSMVFLANDIEFSRYVLLKYFSSFKDVPILFFFWVRRYLNYLQPDFLFMNSLNMTLPGTIGLGMLYLFEIPFLIFGVKEFIKRDLPHKKLLFIWLLTGIIPDSLTNNQQHPGRLLHILPVVIIITTLGAVAFFKWILNLPKFYKLSFSLLFSLVVVLNLMHAFLVFDVHFPRDKGESFDEGLKQAAIYADVHKDQYKKIVFDPRRGVDGPYMISNPYLYVLFYSKYDPAKYQTEPKTFGTNEQPNYQFDKYAFRYINWQVDRGEKGTLFIGSPWSFPTKDLKEGELLETIYLTNGHPGFYVVSPK